MGLLCESFIALQWIFQDPGEGGHPPGWNSRVSGDSQYAAHHALRAPFSVSFSDNFTPFGGNFLNFFFEKIKNTCKN